MLRRLNARVLRKLANTALHPTPWPPPLEGRGKLRDTCNNAHG